MVEHCEILAAAPVDTFRSKVWQARRWLGNKRLIEVGDYVFNEVVDPTIRNAIDGEGA